MHRKTVYVYSEEVHKNINKKIRNFLDHLRALNLEIKYEGVRNKLDIQKFGTLQADMQCFINCNQAGFVAMMQGEPLSLTREINSPEAKQARNHVHIVSLKEYERLHIILRNLRDSNFRVEYDEKKNQVDIIKTKTLAQIKKENPEIPDYILRTEPMTLADDEKQFIDSLAEVFIRLAKEYPHCKPIPTTLEAKP